MITALVLIGLGGLFLILYDHENSDREELWAWLSALSFSFGGFILIVAVICMTCTIETYGKLESVPAVTALYEKAIEDVTAATLQIKGDIAVENLSHSSQIAKAISDKRDYLAGVEQRKASLRAYRTNWFTRQFMTKPPDGLLD